MKSLDLSKFKKASSGENHTVFEHPDGHKIFVSHKALKPGQRADLGKLASKEESAPAQPEQKFAHGGQALSASEWLSKQQQGPQHAEGNVWEDPGSVPFDKSPLTVSTGQSFASPQSQGPAVSAGDWLKQQSHQASGAPGSMDIFGDAMAGAPTEGKTLLPLPSNVGSLMPGSADAMAKFKGQAPAQGQSEQLTNPDLGQAPQASSGAGMGMPKMPGMGGIGAMKRGIRGEADAMGAMGNEQASAGQDFERQMQDLQATQAQHEQAIHAEREAFKHDLANQHIDPNHYIGSMGTGGKIATAIGLILGGIGGGMTGKENPAAKFLQDQINKDVEAQKANLDTKKSLYAANLDELKDARAADAMTRIQLNDMYAHKIATIAQKYQDPIAQARAQQLTGQIDAANQGTAAQLAQQMAIKQAVSQGQFPVEQAVPMLVPKEHQAKVFGEIEAAQNTHRMSDKIMAAFEDAAKENTAMKTGFGLARTPGSVYALHQHMQPTFKDLEGTVRQAAMENTFKNVTPAPGDSEHTVQQKREALQGYLQSKAAAPTAKGYGIDLEKMYAPKGHGFTKR